jgi:hypothetical protein
MRTFTRRLLPALVLLISVTAIAQPENGPPKAAPMTGAEMKVRADAIDGQLRDDYRHVLHLRDLAKKQKDVIKLNCVNDKLVQLKAQANIADSSNHSLQSALSGGAAQAEASPLFRQLESAAESARVLREEANTCMGETELYKQESGVEVSRPDVPDDPGTIDPYGRGDLIVSIEPPAYASPFN